MSQTMLEYVLNSMYIAIASAGLNDHQRALANDTLFRCADLPCAPARAPEILRRIACNAVNQEAAFDLPPPRPQFTVITGGAA
jgi:hypothetical protein